jgi:hypothetical protein
MHFCGKVNADNVRGLVCPRLLKGEGGRSLKAFEDWVSAYVESMDPATRPSEHARRKALMWCANVELPTRGAGQQAVRQCVRLAMDFDEVYQQGRKDAVQDTEWSQTPPQERQVVIETEGAVSSLIDQFRGRILGPEFALYWAGEEVQAYLASPSAGDTLIPFCQDMASATKTTVSDAAMAVLAGQPLTLSAGNIGKTEYSVRMSQDDTEMLRFSTIEILTGNLSAHLVRDSWLPQMRQSAGHSPRQHIQTKDVQKKKEVIRTFLDEQKQAWGWSPQTGWPDGKAPRGFRIATARVWQEQYQQQWGEKSIEALMKDDKRLPQSMPHGGNA